MSKTAHVNQNYIHACDGQRAKLESCGRPLTEIYDGHDLREIIRFYLLQAPISKDNNKQGASPIRSLGELGWRGNAELSKLERSLLASSDIPSFVMLGSNAITNTLKAMDLDGEICTEHPRAVLQRPTKVVLNEDGSASKNSFRKSDGLSVPTRKKFNRSQQNLRLLRQDRPP